MLVCPWFYSLYHVYSRENYQDRQHDGYAHLDDELDNPFTNKRRLQIICSDHPGDISASPESSCRMSCPCSQAQKGNIVPEKMGGSFDQTPETGCEH